jgi:hypothetical protein
VKHYVVLGSGAKLYNSVEPFALDRVARTWRTEDFFSGRFKAESEEITIVFSVLEPPDLERLFQQTTGPVLVVGSCAALSPVWHRFRYSRLKRHQLDAVLVSGDARIKYVCLGDFFLKERRGLSFTTECSEFWDICDYAVSAPGQVILGYDVVGMKNGMSRLLTCVDMLFAPASTALIKKFTRYSYGYNNAADADIQGLNAVTYSPR